MVIIQELRSSARFSNDMKYRYLLERQWKEAIGRVLFIMLNPSTADAEKADPTVARCITYAHIWGFGGVEVANIYALRSTNPKALFKDPDPIGQHNYCMIESAVGRASLVVAAWGTISNDKKHLAEICRIVTQQKDLYCLRTTKNGHPAHPLYLPGDLKPILYKPKQEMINNETKTKKI